MSALVFDVNEVKAKLITTRRIIFTPDVDLKDELKNTAVQITCYDRNGNEVKRVTSADDAEVEDNETTNSTNGTNTGGNDGGNSGGGTNTGGNNGGNSGGGGSDEGGGGFESGS